LGRENVLRRKRIIKKRLDVKNDVKRGRRLGGGLKKDWEFNILKEVWGGYADRRE